ncbi:DUF1684 domain-containing protein [Haladaptatus pallidirubidus]|uniref:DUF1684 domain-containing protein n=1 Tax=Haladaptatus pallidirubidus TaxID=1008152 RepID=A0AAV3UHT4_9EURY|nr:DUF1684 domain-containing protein [Haladaptatus pallidirubidus]
MGSEWQQTLKEQRTKKNQYFRENPHSPIPAEERDSFEGLDYYPIDETYRFEMLLHEHEEKEQLTVATSTEGEREYLRWGEFQFTLDGEQVTIQAYKSDPNEDRLWVPFRDATSGDETYGAGRYLDLERDVHYTKDGMWILDFNEAYNPTCAYNDRYECPLPPMENWLDVPLEAGEQKYS